MINDLALQIKDLNLIHYKKMDILENKLLLSVDNNSRPGYQMISEISKVIDIIDETIFHYVYNDDENTLRISLR